MLGPHSVDFRRMALACLIVGSRPEIALSTMHFVVYFAHSGSLSLQLPAATRLDDFLLLSHPQWSDDRLILEAIALFCVYTCHNMARTSDQAGSESWIDSMDRTSFHVVHNHRRSAAALSTVWSQRKQFFARRTGQA